MILPIVKYGHPALRQKGTRIEEITPDIRQLVSDLLETMYDASGIGLAAQQVGRALQLTVIDVRGVTDRPSSLEAEGRPVAVEDWMPLVLINPEHRPQADPAEGPEGCLSFPEIYADISRPASIEVVATNGEGRPLRFVCGGLLARAIQHETDHLHGILFIDRMTRAVKEELRAELDRLQSATKAGLGKNQ
jgi:peptide deformylase